MGVTRVVMVTGTYRPERCGVAHYVQRLRSALDERGVSSLVLTTREAAGDSNAGGRPSSPARPPLPFQQE